MGLLIFIIFLNLGYAEGDTFATGKMTLKQGTVIGRRFEHLGFESYKGIPFAQPPIGEL